MFDYRNAFNAYTDAVLQNLNIQWFYKNKWRGHPGHCLLVKGIKSRHPECKL